MQESWIATQATHNGTPFEVQHPPDWRLMSYPTAAIVACESEPNALVSFMWLVDIAVADPRIVLRDVVSYNGVSDFVATSDATVETRQWPMTPPHQVIEQDARFTWRGRRCVGVITCAVSDASPPAGARSAWLIWRQAPEERWALYRRTLDMIGDSLKISPCPDAREPSGAAGSSPQSP